MNEREARRLLCDVLSTALKRSKKQQKEAAADLGVHSSYVSSWILGKTFPPENQMNAIVVVFQLTKKEEATVRRLRSMATRGAYAKRSECDGRSGGKRVVLSGANRVFAEWTNLSKEDRQKALRMMEAYEVSSKKE
jgi:DNA-binding transcriptional regulator YdaS (Cro superfamily)